MPTESAISPFRASALATSLSFVAGYVDTVGFVALFGLFTAHVTGNFVLIGAELAHSSGNVLLKLLVFPAFVIAVAATRIAVTEMERRGRSSVRPVLGLQAALLSGFMLAGWFASPVIRSDTALAMFAGFLGAAAMGVQNAASKLVFPSLTATTVMTGNVTQLVIDAVDLMRGVGGESVRKRSVRFVLPILTFASGAVVGAFGYVYFGFPTLLLPVVVLLLLMRGGAPSLGNGSLPEVQPRP